MLLAGGYDADWIRELARQQGAWANIPPKRNRKSLTHIASASLSSLQTDLPGGRSGEFAV